MLMVDAILVGACVTVSCWATVGLSASVWLWILLWLHHGCSGAMDTFAIASWVEVDVIQFLDMLSTTTIWKGVWRAWQKVGSEESAGGNLKRWRSREGGHGEKGTRHMKHDVSCKEWSRPFPPPLTLKSKAGFSASLNQRGRKLTFDCYFTATKVFSYIALFRFLRIRSNYSADVHGVALWPIKIGRRSGDAILNL